MSRSTSSDTVFGLAWSRIPGIVNYSVDSTPAASPATLKDIRSTIESLKIRRQTQFTLEEIARRLNPLLRGWIKYYGRFTPSALEAIYRHVNLTLLRWSATRIKALLRCVLPKLAAF